MRQKTDSQIPNDIQAPQNHQKAANDIQTCAVAMQHISLITTGAHLPKEACVITGGRVRYVRKEKLAPNLQEAHDSDPVNARTLGQGVASKVN